MKLGQGCLLLLELQNVDYECLFEDKLFVHLHDSFV